MARTWSRIAGFALGLAGIGAACLGVGPAGAAATATGSTGSTGFNGPVVSYPPANPTSYPAGEVCRFPVRLEFPVNQVVQRTWTNDTGQPVFATGTGLLIAKATNLDTGASVLANLDGTGTYSYLADGSVVVSGGGGILVSLHTGDNPPNELLFSKVDAHSFISVRLATTGGHTTKTVLQLAGPHEDLCQLLTP